jgi:ATP-dependent DNA helicase RecG
MQGRILCKKTTDKDKIGVKLNIMQEEKDKLAAYWLQLRRPLELEISHGCLDSAVAGTSIGSYSSLWYQRFPGGSDSDREFAEKVAKWISDYHVLPVDERKRRIAKTIDLLRQREIVHLDHREPDMPMSQRKKTIPKPVIHKKHVNGECNEEIDICGDLPTGEELLNSPLAMLAPRAGWPRIAQKLGIITVRDLLNHIPRAKLTVKPFTDLRDGEKTAVVGKVVRRDYDTLHSKKITQKLYKYTLTLTDEITDNEVWVTSITTESERSNPTRWSPNKLKFKEGSWVLATGKIDRTGKLIILNMEDISALNKMELEYYQTGISLPYYPLTNGVYQGQVRKAVLRALNTLKTNAHELENIDPLPHSMREKLNLPSIIQCWCDIHNAQDEEAYNLAKRRMIFEELLIPQLALAHRRYDHHSREDAPILSCGNSITGRAELMVDFPLTNAQIRVMKEIEHDLRSPRPMNRLLQGDVGSGKTIVAAATVAFAYCSGVQSAVMAPTELLAEQLFNIMSKLLKPLNVIPVYITGSVTGAARRDALEKLRTGLAHVAIGTHALFSEGVEFDDLGVVIVDEQHKFGVVQRAALRAKGISPNTMVMSATPIPRSLSLTLFGDLDISLLDELPPGRQPVETHIKSYQERRELFQHVRDEVEAGHQAYIVCPLIETSEMLQADSAVDLMVELQKRVFYGIKMGLVHGRMRTEEREDTMRGFRDGEIKILVATTVIEVGVDVPNATIMVIHGAERFGLAQLHQLRGRVGRSTFKSTCYLVTSEKFKPKPDDDKILSAHRRLQVMEESQDGFVIADADLDIRGPGEYIGTRQSGVNDYQIADISRDKDILLLARNTALVLIKNDPELSHPALAKLRIRMQRMLAKFDGLRE